MTSHYLLPLAAQMPCSVTTVVCSWQLTTTRHTHQGEHRIRENTENSHQKTDLHSYNIAPSRKTITTSLPQQYKNKTYANSFTFGLPGGALGQWPSAPFFPPQALLQGKWALNSNTSTTAAQTAATDSRSPSSPPPSACQPWDTTPRSWD